MAAEASYRRGAEPPTRSGASPQGRGPVILAARRIGVYWWPVGTVSVRTSARQVRSSWLLLDFARLSHVFSVNAAYAGRVNGVDVYVAVDRTVGIDTDPVFRVIHALRELKSEFHIRGVAL